MVHGRAPGSTRASHGGRAPAASTVSDRPTCRQWAARTYVTRESAHIHMVCPRPHSPEAVGHMNHRRILGAPLYESTWNFRRCKDRSMPCHPPPATCHPLPATRLPVNRHLSPVTGHPLPATVHPPRATRHPSPATRHPPPATRHPPPYFLNPYPSRPLTS